MKRSLAILLTLALTLTLFAGCDGAKTASTSTPSAVTPTSAAPPAGGKVTGDFILATGGTGGTYYPVGGAIAQIMNRVTGSNITVNATGASVENIRLMADNGADLALIQTDNMSYAMNGTVDFKDGAVTGISSIATIYPEVVQIIAPADDKTIVSVADLKGKRVSVGAPGSGTETNALQILSAYGMTMKDIDARHLSFNESSAGIQDGNLDAMFCTAAVPTAAVTELAVQKQVKLIPLDAQHLEKLIKDYPFFAKYTVKKEDYNAPEDADTVAIKALLACRTAMSEQDVYLLTQALFENLSDFGAAHAKGKECSIKGAMDGVIPGTVHPGAAKYFTEKGVKVP